MGAHAIMDVDDVTSATDVGSNIKVFHALFSCNPMNIYYTIKRWRSNLFLESFALFLRLIGFLFAARLRFALIVPDHFKSSATHPTVRSLLMDERAFVND